MIKQRQTLGAIDIGSNAIRLLIEYVETYGDKTEFKKAVYIRVPIRLGEDVFSIKKVGPEKKKLLMEAITGFSHLLKAYQVEAFRACATSAMREAENGKDIIKTLAKSTGIKVGIISGQQEANLIFKAGDFDSLIDKQKNYVYMDVGGGSTEIILYSDYQAVSAKSFRLGTVRILGNAVPKKEPDKFVAHLKEISQEHRPVAIIGSGGNINKVHKLLRKKSGEPVRLTELEKLYSELQTMTFRQRVEDVQLNEYRADVIMPAIYLFITAARAARVREIIVPKVGLVDGIINDLYGRGKK